MYAQDSIELLNRSGIQFKRHEDEGIEVNDFAELLITSGLILTNDIKWISFHRSAYTLRRSCQSTCILQD